MWEPCWTAQLIALKLRIDVFNQIFKMHLKNLYIFTDPGINEHIILYLNNDSCLNR